MSSGATSVKATDIDSKGTDKIKLCYRCGDADHKAVACKKVATLCAPCGDIGVRDEDRNHIPGSGKCAAFSFHQANLHMTSCNK